MMLGGGGGGGGGAHRCLDGWRIIRRMAGAETEEASGSRRQRNRHEAPDISGPRFGRWLYRKDDTRPKILSTTCTYVRKSTCSTFIMVILGNLGNDVYYTLLVRVSGSLQSKVGEKIFFEIKEFVYKPFYTN